VIETWPGAVAMAYVPGFKWDIFISYPMEAESWTKRFLEDLQDGTALPSAKGLEIYFARKNWQLGGVSDDMLEAARASALFVAVLTKHSLAENEKRFLQKEMEAFRESSSLKGRFCPIPLYPVAGSQLSKAMPIDNPGAFWNTNLEFFFYDDGIPLWLERDTEPQPGRYKRTVKKVAYQLRDRLDEIRNGTSGAPSNKGPFSRKAVLLARKEPESNVAKEWDDIRNLLVNDGATIVPSATSESDPIKLEAEFETAVRTADLFVQLFSPLDSLDRAMAQLKSVEGRKSIPILQWRKRHSNSRMDLAILEGLDEDGRKFCEGENVRTGLLEDFKLAIRDELEKPTKPPPEITISEKPYLYITADTSDLGLARKLQAAARKRTVAVVMEEDESQRREDFENGLMQASGVVFLHGNATRQFVDRWLREFVRKTRLLKIHPMLAALYQAPPEKTEEDEPLVPIDELRVEGSQKEFTLQGIEKICAELCGDRG
jgi:hypothetical protein